ncbi:hypothetical protein F4825DRAFT_427801 [Nemania diffusa]|nr:hypothetical protein F4825DRAFT_427801 [Nemania diffusa]
MDGTFDPNRCAEACTARTQYNLANGSSSRPCRFFNTYLLNRNGAYFAQYCSVYTQLWNASYATNAGQFGSDGYNYTISQSVGYYNSSDPGPCQSTKTSTTAIIPPTIPPNLNPTASCDTNGYVIQNNVLGRLNFTTAQIIKNVVTAGTNIDAMGYNSLDNYLYASNSALGVSNLIQLGGTGLLRSIAPLPPNSARQNWNNGDVDEKGQYWASYNGGDWIQVDLAPGSSTYGQVVASGRADSMGFTTLDWVYVPGTGNVLWALGTAFNHDQTELMSFDRTNHTWSLVNNFSKTAGANAWSAAYAGPNQSIIASEATTGQIWQFPLLGTGNKATRLSVGLPASNSDGALCVDTLL